MSLLEAPPVRPDPMVSGAPRTRRRLLIGVAIAASTALLVAGGVLETVHASDTAALDQVHVFLDPKPVTCKDPADVTTVARGDDGSGDDVYRVPAVRGALGLDCVLSVVLRNDSDRDIDLTAFTLPFYGPSSAMGIRSDYALSQQSQPTPVDGGRDVVYRWGSAPLVVLGAGDSFVYRFHLTSDGCRQAGSSFTSSAPIATLATGTATRDAGLEGPGFGVLGVHASAQPCS